MTPSLLFAPYVVAWRTSMLMLLALQPNALRSREARRMVEEKWAAAFEGGVAMQSALLGTSFEIWRATLSGRDPARAAAAGMERAARAAAAPASRRVRANAKRLSRRKTI